MKTSTKIAVAVTFVIFVYVSFVSDKFEENLQEELTKGILVQFYC